MSSICRVRPANDYSIDELKILYSNSVLSYTTYYMFERIICVYEIDSDSKVIIKHFKELNYLQQCCLGLINC